MLADGDGVADIDPAADGDHGVGIEAAVGTHGELPAGPAVANPAHRFTQEVGGAASGVGPAASHSTPGLTAPSATHPPDNRRSPQTRASPVRESSLLRILSPSRASQLPQTAIGAPVRR